MFIDLRGRDLLAKNLYRNFVAHLCNLSDYGLVSAEAHFKIVQKLQRMLAADAVGRRSLAHSRRAQLAHWQQFGRERQQQKLREEPAALLVSMKREDAAAAAAAATTTPSSMTTRTTTSALALLSSSAASASTANAAGSLLPQVSGTRDACSKQQRKRRNL